MLPSSPVSMGILPSNKTLAAGVSHCDNSRPRIGEMFEQLLVSEDPFTDDKVVNQKFEGIT